MFGGSVAMVYGLLMVANVVYTLFFATAIVCGTRGLGWWATHLYQKRKAGRAAAQADPSMPPTTSVPAAA